MTKIEELGFLDSLLSPNPQKRAAEKFFLKWNVVWLIYFGGIVVTKAYEDFDAWSYMKVGLLLSVLPITIPLLFPQLSGETGIPWYERFTTKANIFIFTISWIGNYFWTHYFYKVLGCEYTMPAHRLNDVPFALYLITHSYFHLYHGLGAIGLRALWKKIAKMNVVSQYTIVSIIMVIVSYTTAVMEVATIASFPYYTYKDVWRMWVIGSGFYGIYFLISFPMFFRIDEEVSSSNKKTDGLTVPHRWTLAETLKDALAYGMFTTMLLDLWRITIGQIHDDGGAAAGVSWIF